MSTAVKVNGFLQVTVETEPDEERFKKWQLRPMGGWPNGIDPYPNLSDEDIARIIVHGHDHTLRAKVIGRQLDLGDAFDLDLENQKVRFHVIETKSDCNPGSQPIQTIIATART